MIRVYLIVGAVAAALASLALARWDAQRDLKREIEAKANEARIEAIEKSQETINEIQQLDDLGLRRALCERLRPSGRCD